MTMNSYAHYAYRATDVANMSPLELIIKLYDGAIGFLGKAVNAISKGDRLQKLENINKTRAIIDELLASLKVEEGGDVAKNLQDLYTYMLVELTRANAAGDIEKIIRVQGLLKILKGGWEQVKITSKAEAPRTSSVMVKVY
jgi:flagellar protein FliS